MPTATFTNFLDRSRTLSDVRAASSLLHWDQETYMPDGAAAVRAEQSATLDTLAHQMSTSGEYAALMETVREEAERGELEQWEQAVVKESYREFERSRKLPDEFVREMSRAQSLAHHAWKKGREQQDFGIFAPSLEQIVALKRQAAEYYGYTENPYDALIDQYEPGMTAAELRPVFDRLREGTGALLQKIAGFGAAPDDSVLFTDFDADQQLAFSKKIIQQLGFDFNIGRVDLSAHPFCTSFGSSDVRLTTRIFRNDLRSCLFGLMHEAGHGMYEQGFAPHLIRTPLAGGASMGIHESQSLLWENMVGRSEEFWSWAFPQLAATFPTQLVGLDSFSFFQSINVMKPSFIRVEADELTYNMHIILRFQIEDDLINGRMSVADIPAVWNQKSQEYLGIVPPNDSLGCLQDIHWSFGGFGYFASYTLGKLYAAMFFNRAAEQMPELRQQIARGEFGNLLGWLRENLHQWGKAKNASQLVNDICGRPLTETDFLAYLDRKVERVYGGNAE
ncbi:MAG: carboxypeptidase M32 [Chlorobi bacterium]|nr:carboxypeptidase M32 [Chlorobiota bacterium]